MTWKITVRGNRDRPIVAEYMCPVHGRFALEMPRDANGDPPASACCPTIVEHEHHCEDPPCSDCGYTTWSCDQQSPYAISAPGFTGVRRVEAVRGGWEKPARSTFLDTRNLGEGQDLDDWREDRAKIRDQQRRDSLKELIDG